MNKEFISAINQLCAERNIPRASVIEAVESALKTAYKKDYGTKDQNVDVDLNEDTGVFTVYEVKVVAEEISDPELEMTIAEAKKFKKDAELGDEIRMDVTPSGFGRIAAQAAKQVILQRVQEAERDVIFEAFKEREDELLTAQISRIDRGQMYIEIDKNTIPFPREHRVQSEKYYVGQRLKVYLEKVEKTVKGPNLVITRRSPKLVEKMFEFEIPEIKAKVVEIKGIAREPGIRTKIAVFSSDPKVDPVGACVGQRGVRIQTIMEELMGEMLDVVQYKEKPEDFLKQALAPAKIVVIDLHEKEKVANIFVEESQRPLAIGRSGQNVRLASILTGYEINLKDISEYTGVLPSEDGAVVEETPEMKEQKAEVEKAKKKEAAVNMSGTTIDQLDIPDNLKTKLKNAGIIEASVLAQMNLEDLTMIGGIGKASAEKIIEAVRG